MRASSNFDGVRLSLTVQAKICDYVLQPLLVNETMASYQYLRFNITAGRGGEVFLLYLDPMSM